jgi:hypothetical protein
MTKFSVNVRGWLVQHERWSRWLTRGALALPLAGLGFLLPSAQAAPGQDKLVCDRVIDDFTGSKVGAFPAGWRTKDASEMPLAKSKNLYVVEADGKRRVLHAVFRDEAITIGKSVPGWDLEAYPVLQWQWKAITLPNGGNEDSMSANDCAASVYSLWDIGFPFYVDSLKYTWSSTLKVGTDLKKRLGHDYVRVMQSGVAARARWQTVRANVKDDHSRLFGEKEPRAPSGIAVLTDADATESEAEAYYADFRLCRYQR